MQTADSILHVLSHHKGELMSRFKIKDIALFGSYVRGQQASNSDIDILVEFDEAPSIFEFVRIENYLGELLNGKVDLVMKSALKPNLARQILSEAIAA